MSNKKNEPFISADKNLPEITLKVVLISILLVIILCASNAYLGLKLGNTISASIPAAILGMGILRFFKNSNILENNIIQTCASVGESVVAGVAYVLPSLILLHYWQNFHYWQTLLLCIFGGVLGMLFSIPVRRIMLNNPTLRFPEGTAIAAVVKAGAESNTDMKPLITGGIVGSLISLFQTGFQVMSDQWSLWFLKNNTAFGIILGFSPALLAAGYIVGVQVALAMLIGVIINVGIAFPVLTSHYIQLTHATNVNDIISTVWSNNIRYLGIGTMLIGGIWTILTLLKPIYDGLRASFSMLKPDGINALPIIPRTERDIPGKYTIMLGLLVAILAFILFYNLTSPQFLANNTGLHIFLTALAVLFILIGGFLFSSISSYFAGLVGSTNNPASSLFIACILLLSLMFIFILTISGHSEMLKSLELTALIVMITTVIGCSLTIANDSIQDFKAGQLVGATPWKQQVILLLGIVVGSIVITPILQLLYDAYGMAGVFPRPGMPVAQMLPAPQASMITAVLNGVFNHNIPWNLLEVGAAIGIVCIVIDEIGKRRGYRFPVLAVGVGIYLPLSITTCIIVGGILNYVVKLRLLQRLGHRHFSQDEETRKRLHRGIIIACGVVSGASIMGVLLAIPFALFQNADALKIMPDSLTSIAHILGLLTTIALVVWLYRSILHFKIKKD